MILKLIIFYGGQSSAAILSPNSAWGATMWSVDVLEEDGRFVVRTVVDGDTQDMTFVMEGFAQLYARGQRIHFQTLSEIALNECSVGVNLTIDENFDDADRGGSWTQM